MASSVANIVSKNVVVNFERCGSRSTRTLVPQVQIVSSSKFQGMDSSHTRIGLYVESDAGRNARRDYVGRMQGYHFGLHIVTTC
jgi:hypothetical protein